MSVFRELLMSIGGSPTPTPTPTPRLPEAYQEVEYIQSSGTQYINTGYVHKTTSVYDLSFAMTSFYSQYNTVFGARNNWNTSDAFDLGVRNNNDTYINLGGVNPARFYTLALGEKANVVMDIEKITINDVTQTYIDGVNPDYYPITNMYTTDGIYSIYLFALNQRDSLIEPSIIKLYHFKIYEGSTLVKEFVPCYRKVDDIIGMYDIVNDVFYTNNGSGTFAKGQDVNPTPSSELPADYQKVEYVENRYTSNHYVITGYKATINTKIEIEAMCTDTTTSYRFEQITGGRSSYHASTAIQIAYRTGENAIYIDYGTAGTSPTNANVSLNTKFKIILSNNYIAVDQTTLTKVGLFSESDTSPYSLWIFDVNNAGSTEGYFIGRIYSYKIYESGELVRQYVPCYRKSDNYAGLYEIKTGDFYLPVGLSTLIAGPDVE